MKSFWSFVVVVCVLICGICKAAKGDGCNGAWSFDDSTKTLTLHSGCQLFFYSASDYPWYQHREHTEFLYLEQGVTALGAYAFEGFSFLRNVTIPQSLTTFGSYCFRYCSRLESVWIPKNAFVSNGAFAGCTSLKSIDVDPGNTDFESRDGVLFRVATSGLMLIQYPCEKGSEYIIPDGVSVVSDQAFQGCSGLTNITIPGSVETIGNFAFAGCDLTSLILPEGLKTLASSAFSDNKNLVFVVLPKSLSIMYDSVFARCTSLSSIAYSGDKSVTLGESGKAQPFRDCPALEYVCVGQSYSGGSFCHVNKRICGTINTPVNDCYNVSYDMDSQTFVRQKTDLAFEMEARSNGCQEFKCEAALTSNVSCRDDNGKSNICWKDVCEPNETLANEKVYVVIDLEAVIDAINVTMDELAQTINNVCNTSISRDMVAWEANEDGNLSVVYVIVDDFDVISLIVDGVNKCLPQ